MNGPMKQLAVLVGVLGIALFGMVGMAASAQSAIPYSVHGLYAVTGFSSCSPDGLGVMEADYTFSNKGTVSAQGVVRNIDASGGWSAAFEATFTYEVTQEGRITFAYPWHGLKIYRPIRTGNNGGCSGTPVPATGLSPRTARPSPSRVDPQRRSRCLPCPIMHHRFSGCRRPA